MVRNRSRIWYNEAASLNYVTPSGLVPFVNPFTIIIPPRWG